MTPETLSAIRIAEEWEAKAREATALAQQALEQYGRAMAALRDLMRLVESGQIKSLDAVSEWGRRHLSVLLKIAPEQLTPPNTKAGDDE